MKKVIYFITILLFVNVLPLYSAVTDDAVSYWNFNEGSGADVFDAQELNDGEIIDGTWTTGKLGNAIDFDGVDDYVEVADDNSLSFGDGLDDSPFTFAAWIKMDDATRFEIMSKGDFNSNTKEYSLKQPLKQIFLRYLKLIVKQMKRGLI